jgi:phosphate transport system substrate-binding protein
MSATISLALAAALSQSAAPLPIPAPQDTLAPEPRDPKVAELVAQFPDYRATDQPLSGSLTITGSATMSRMLVAMGEAFEQLYPSVKVEVNQGGSARGLAALRAGECDIASVSRDMTPEEIADIERATGKKAHVIPVGRDAACIYVNVGNPLSTLTREQLNGIFALTHSLTNTMVMRWTDIEADSPLGDDWVMLYVLDPGHGTMQQFIRLVMPGERLQTSMCHRQPTPSAVVNACCAYLNSIGIAPFVYRQPRAKLLSVKMTKDSPAVEPNFWTIHRGEYPMTMPLNVVALSAPDAPLAPIVLEWVRYMWSQSAQDTVAALGGVVPDPAQMPDVVRQSLKSPAKAPSSARTPDSGSSTSGK